MTNDTDENLESRTFEEPSLRCGLRRAGGSSARRASFAGHVEHDLVYHLANELGDLVSDGGWAHGADPKADAYAAAHLPRLGAEFPVSH